MEVFLNRAATLGDDYEQAFAQAWALFKEEIGLHEDAGEVELEEKFLSAIDSGVVEDHYAVSLAELLKSCSLTAISRAVADAILDSQEEAASYVIGCESFVLHTGSGYLGYIPTTAGGRLVFKLAMQRVRPEEALVGAHALVAGEMMPSNGFFYMAIPGRIAFLRWFSRGIAVFNQQIIAGDTTAVPSLILGSVFLCALFHQCPGLRKYINDHAVDRFDKYATTIEYSDDPENPHVSLCNYLGIREPEAAEMMNGRDVDAFLVVVLSSFKKPMGSELQPNERATARMNAYSGTLNLTEAYEGRDALWAGVKTEVGRKILPAITSSFLSMFGRQFFDTVVLEKVSVPAQESGLYAQFRLLIGFASMNFCSVFYEDDRMITPQGKDLFKKVRGSQKLIDWEAATMAKMNAWLGQEQLDNTNRDLKLKYAALNPDVSFSMIQSRTVPALYNFSAAVRYLSAPAKTSFLNRLKGDYHISVSDLIAIEGLSAITAAMTDEERQLHMQRRAEIERDLGDQVGLLAKFTR